MIYFRSFIYRLLIVVLVGIIIFLGYWAIFGAVPRMAVLIITISALVLSPRFEVIETHSDQKLQMKGFPVILKETWQAWTKK